MDLISLQKLSCAPPAPKDLLWAGSLEAYDEEIDRVTVKGAKKLRTFEKEFYRVTARDDSHLQSFAESEEPGAGNVFATEAVLSHIMTCARGAFAWDIVITYLPGGKIFLDMREGCAANSPVESLTVNETAHTPPPEAGRFAAVIGEG